MAKLARQIDRLRREIAEFLEGAAATTRDVNRAFDGVAELLLKCLFDGSHPAAGQLQALKDRVAADRDGTLYEPIPKVAGKVSKTERRKKMIPERHFFMPQPGISDREARRYWKLQVLLYSATRSPAHRDRLAEHLELEQKTMTRAATVAAEASINFWGVAEFLGRLHEALEDLEFPDLDLPFTLEGREVKHALGSFRLSPQEAKLLQMLIDRPGQPVTNSALQKAGLNHPAQCKQRLVGKLREKDIELSIDPRNGGYVLHAD